MEMNSIPGNEDVMDREAIDRVLKSQRTFFRSGATLPVETRIAALTRLRHSIRKHEHALADAMHADLGKAASESYMCETGLVLDELGYILRHLRRWTAERRVPTELANFPSVSSVVQEPYGRVLIMAPWNYPILLCLEPLLGAIAAGNTAVLKPSRYAPNCTAALKLVIEEAFPPEYVALIPGGREENQYLLDQEFDYIFFTGSVAVGKVVMEKAARHLTPVTLELGGKSPVVIDATADLKLAARRVAFGKILNCGQTCIAPDYLLIEESVKEEFLRYYERAVGKMLGRHPLKNREYGKIINRKHYDRLCGLMEEDRIIFGGERDADALKIAPTVMDGVTAESPIMQEEIFGPILPVLTFRKITEAKTFIENRPKPLACYVFSNDRKTQEMFKRSVSFGGGCINDVINHICTKSMGFGGVGASGMGAYHGRLTFQTFSHAKSILQKSRRIDLPMRYHPYRKLYAVLARRILH